jgi:WLM domain
VAINNLSDRQYCCVWWIEESKDAYRPDIARSLLARVARHVNPILRERGWRVKRLVESFSPSFAGVCYTNGRDDADAASANIMLNLRTQPSRTCRQFRTFHQVLAVMVSSLWYFSSRPWLHSFSYGTVVFPAS